MVDPSSSETNTLERVRLLYSDAFYAAINDFVEETEQVCQINPKSAIETSSIDPAIQERIMPFHHHEAFAP